MGGTEHAHPSYEMDDKEQRPTLTVLIIDDQSVSRMIPSEPIDSIQGDVRVEAFGSPVIALEWAKPHLMDLVLTDFKMSVMNSVEVSAIAQLAI